MESLTIPKLGLTYPWEMDQSGLLIDHETQIASKPLLDVLPLNNIDKLIFELHLGEDKGKADISCKVKSGEDLKDMLQSIEHLYPKGMRYAKYFKSFIKKLSDEGQEKVKNLWLEFDIASKGVSEPSFCFMPQLPLDKEITHFIKEWPNPLLDESGEQEKQINNIVKHLKHPEQDIYLMLYMLGRKDPKLRLHASRFTLENLSTYLKAIKFPGTLPDLSQIIPKESILDLQLDVALFMENKIGIEYHGGDHWPERIKNLYLNGFFGKEYANALTDFMNTDEYLGQNDWIKSYSHFKIACDGEKIQSKIYVNVTPSTLS